MSKQQSKRHRHRRPYRRASIEETMRKVSRSPISEDELGSSAVRRFLDPKSEPIYNSIDDSARDLFGGKFTFSGVTDSGITLMRGSEIKKIRGTGKFVNSRLGGVSYELSRLIIKDMLPASANEPADLVLGRFVISRPRGKWQYLIAGISDAGSIPSERVALENGVDEYEKVTHEWAGYRPHVTLGRISTSDFSLDLLPLTKKLNGEFSGETFVARPAE